MESLASQVSCLLLALVEHREKRVWVEVCPCDDGSGPQVACTTGVSGVQMGAEGAGRGTFGKDVGDHPRGCVCVVVEFVGESLLNSCTDLTKYEVVSTSYFIESNSYSRAAVTKYEVVSTSYFIESNS